jgi:hypothetical protein
MPYEAIERAERGRAAQREPKPTVLVDSLAAGSQRATTVADAGAPGQAGTATGPMSAVASTAAAVPADSHPTALEPLSASPLAAADLNAPAWSRLPESACAAAEPQTAPPGESPRAGPAPVTLAMHADSISTGEADVGRWSGSVPVLFAGELVELDLYARHQGLGAVGEGQQMILSLLDANGARLEATASLQSNRLRVQLHGPAAGDLATTRVQVHAVGELAARLGWTFEGVEHADGHADGAAMNQLL